MNYVFEGLLSLALLLLVAAQVPIPKENITSANAASNTTVRYKESTVKVQPTSSPTTAATTTNSSSSGGDDGNNNSNTTSSDGGSAGGGYNNVTKDPPPGQVNPQKGGAERVGFSAPLLLTSALVWRLWP